MIISFYNVGGTPGPGPTPTPTPDTATTALLNSIVDGSVTELHLGTGCTYIKEYTFLKCTDLTSVTMDSVTEIGIGAFQDSTALTDVVFSSGLTSIEDIALGSWDKDMSISHLTFTNPVPPTLGNEVFRGNFGPISVDVPAAGLSAYTDWINTYLDPSIFILNYNLPEVIEYASISGETVSGVGATQSFSVSGENSFGIEELISSYMVFQSALTSTPVGFVSGSTAITSMVFKDSLTGIGANSFTDCSNLMMLTFNTATPPTVGTDAFSGVPSAGTIFCPASAQSAYTTWKNGINAISGWSVNNWVRLDSIDNETPFDAIAWSTYYDNGDDKWVSEVSGLTTEEMNWGDGGNSEYGWFGDHRWNGENYAQTYDHVINTDDPEDPYWEEAQDVERNTLPSAQITVEGKSTTSYVLDLTTMTDYVPLYGASSDPYWYTMVYDGDGAPDSAIVFVRLV